MFDLANRGLLTPQGCPAPDPVNFAKKGFWLNAVDFTDLTDEASDPAAPHHPRRRRVMVYLLLLTAMSHTICPLFPTDRTL